MFQVFNFEKGWRHRVWLRPPQPGRGTSTFCRVCGNAAPAPAGALFPMTNSRLAQSVWAQAAIYFIAKRCRFLTFQPQSELAVAGLCGGPNDECRSRSGIWGGAGESVSRQTAQSADPPSRSPALPARGQALKKPFSLSAQPSSPGECLAPPFLSDSSSSLSSLR